MENDKNLDRSLGREFLWFNGSGAVHKGLDLLLEIFKDLPDLILNVVGPVEAESDFMEIYRVELNQTPNINFHGFLTPESHAFHSIIEKSFCFISPSCSEGISTAAVTCLQIGLYPILSKECGIVLPKDCGVVLETSSIESIKKSILEVLKKSDDELKVEMNNCKVYANAE